MNHWCTCLARKINGSTRYGNNVYMNGPLELLVIDLLTHHLHTLVSLYVCSMYPLCARSKALCFRNMAL